MYVKPSTVLKDISKQKLKKSVKSLLSTDAKKKKKKKTIVGEHNRNPVNYIYTETLKRNYT